MVTSLLPKLLILPSNSLDISGLINLKKISDIDITWFLSIILTNYLLFFLLLSQKLSQDTLDNFLQLH